jgi:hypothetical protein
MFEIKFKRGSILKKYNQGESFPSLAKKMGITRQAIQLKVEKELQSLFEKNPSLDAQINGLALDDSGELHWGLNLSDIDTSRIILLVLRSKYGYYSAGSSYAFKEQRSLDSIRTHLLKVVNESEIPLAVYPSKRVLSGEEDLISLSLDDEFNEFFYFTDPDSKGGEVRYIIGFGHKSMLQNICRWVDKKPFPDDGFKRDIPSLYSIFPEKAKRKEGFSSEEDFYNYLVKKRNYIYGMKGECKEFFLEFIKELVSKQKKNN